MDLYPADPAAGSPFNTGDANALTPQYKRIAALQGDYVEIAPKRRFLHAIADEVDVWSYSRSSHQSDVLAYIVQQSTSEARTSHRPWGHGMALTYPMHSVVGTWPTISFGSPIL